MGSCVSQIIKSIEILLKFHKEEKEGEISTVYFVGLPLGLLSPIRLNKNSKPLSDPFLA